MTPSRRTVLQASLASALTAVAGPGRAATPFFKLYMMIPNNQPARMVWGTLAAAQMSRIGIDVVSSFAPFTVIGPRRAKGDGKTHVDGGWDCYLERYLVLVDRAVAVRAVRQHGNAAQRPELLLRR